MPFPRRFGIVVFAGLAACAATIWASSPGRGTAEITVVDLPDLSTRNDYYVSNRAPLAPSALIKLPVGSIQPQGWLGEYLKRQRSGLTGHLGEISAWLQTKDNAWLAKDGKGEWGWEELPYWLKGYGNLAYILNDQDMIKQTKFWIDGTINSQRPDGDFGPAHYSSHGDRDYWANMIMIFVLQSWYEHSHDQRVITLMSRYFKYLSTLPDDKYLAGYWQRMRGGDTLHSVFWLYNRTGEPWLLEFARKVHRRTANWSQANTLPDWHNVNVAQGFREPATYYLLTRDKADVKLSYGNLARIREMYGQVPGGMWGGDEISRPGHDDPHQAIETCAIVEQLFSNEMMLWITGDPFWADHAEEVAFNTAPAATLPDLRGLRYLTAPNQVVSDSTNHAPGINNEGPFFLMSALSSRCCQHNHAQGWPYYSENLWMATPDNGAAAMLYAANTTHMKVGSGGTVRLSMEGNYPFEEAVKIHVHTARAEKFPLYLRVPRWSHRTTLTINGVAQTLPAASNGRYIKIARQWRDGDVVTLGLPMDISVQRWERNHNAASVNFGPLTFSLRIGEKYIARDAKKTAIVDSKWQDKVDLTKWKAYEIQPTTPWNYGLVLADRDPASSFEVVRKPWPKDNFPFTLDSVPLMIRAKARRIPAWKIDEYGLAGALRDSPVLTDQPEEQVTLVPMGAARLRIAAFPVAGTGATARHWQ